MPDEIVQREVGLVKRGENIEIITTRADNVVVVLLDGVEKARYESHPGGNGDVIGIDTETLDVGFHVITLVGVNYSMTGDLMVKIKRPPHQVAELTYNHPSKETTQIRSYPFKVVL